MFIFSNVKSAEKSKDPFIQFNYILFVGSCIILYNTFAGVLLKLTQLKLTSLTILSVALIGQLINLPSF